MKPLRNLSIIGLSCFVLSGCITNKAADEVVMPKMQQNTYLSHAKPPQQFGFSIYSTEDGMAYSGSCRLHPNHLVSAKLSRGNIPVINIRGKSKRNKMNVLIDFSSPTSWLEFSTSQKFGAQFMGKDSHVIPYRGSYNTGGVDAYAGVIAQLRIDTLFMENIPFQIRMAQGSLGPLARGIKSPSIDAILGYDNLRNFEYIQINLIRNTILFSSTTPYIPHSELLVATANMVNSHGHGLAIKGHVDGVTTPVILDLAGDYYFARGDVKVSVTKELDLNYLSFDHVPTLILPVHNVPPRVGRKLLAPYIITICSKKGVVYFEELQKNY